MFSVKLLFLAANLAVIIHGQITGGPKHGKVVVCYVATWAVYRPAPGSFSLEDLEPGLCTHIVYSFAGLNETSNAIHSLDPWQDLEKDYGKAGYKRIVALKERYPHLKVTIAIGGWNEGSPKYSKMASSPASRKAFINSVLLFLEKYKFDGLDLDWEYPTKRDGQPFDRANFVSLVKELKEAFESKNYILTAALGAGKSTMESAYDLARLSRHLDLIHMMCYDYHGTWDGFVGANAPLRGLDEDDVLNLEFTIKYMLAQGVSPYKMVLGLPMYGRTFILNDPKTRDIVFGQTPVQSIGFKGPLTNEAGFMGYNEICTEMTNKSANWQRYWHMQTETPYLRDGDKVITYDDPRSIAIKVKMAIDYGLGGLMVWSIDTDDFKGACETPSDAYMDFQQRLDKIYREPVLQEALKNLNLPDAQNSLSRNKAYVISDGRLNFRIPDLSYSNYALMQTINIATSIAVEEKRIMDEIERVTKENEIAVVADDVPDNAFSFKCSSLLIICSLFAILTIN